MITYNKKIYLITLIGFLAFCASLLSPIQVRAARTNFYTTPVFSEAQTDPTLDYFSATVQPKQELPLTVRIHNTSSSEAQTFRVQLAVATTSNAGKIDYTPNRKKPQPKTAQTLLTLVPKAQHTQEITIEPATAQTVTFPVTIPETGLKGTILGSVFVHQLTEGTRKNTRVGIQSEFAMTLPVILKQADAPTQQPKLSIDTLTAKPKAVTAVVANAAPVMFGHITMKTEIFRPNRTKALYTATQHQLEMAPNSTFTHTSHLDKALSKGTYHLKITLTSGTKTFHLAQKFTVTAADNQQTQRFQLNQKPHYILFWLCASLILLILLGVILWALIKRTRKK